MDWSVRHLVARRARYQGTSLIAVPAGQGAESTCRPWRLDGPAVGRRCSSGVRKPPGRGSAVRATDPGDSMDNMKIVFSFGHTHDSARHHPAPPGSVRPVPVRHGDRAAAIGEDNALPGGVPRTRIREPGVATGTPFRSGGSGALSRGLPGRRNSRRDPAGAGAVLLAPGARRRPPAERALRPHRQRPVPPLRQGGSIPRGTYCAAPPAPAVHRGTSRRGNEARGGRHALRRFFPRIHDQGLDPTIALGDYVETYLERDIRRIGEIRNLSAFRRFVRLCAGRVGQLLDYTALGADAGVTHTTARGWLSLLEASYILFRLEPFHANVRKRLVRSPKLYFHDVGLAAWLLDIENAGQLGTHPLRGALFENAVAVEALKHSYNAGRATARLVLPGPPGPRVRSALPIGRSPAGDRSEVRRHDRLGLVFEPEPGRRNRARSPGARGGVRRRSPRSAPSRGRGAPGRDVRSAHPFRCRGIGAATVAGLPYRCRGRSGEPSRRMRSVPPPACGGLCRLKPAQFSRWGLQAVRAGYCRNCCSRSRARVNRSRMRGTGSSP